MRRGLIWIGMLASVIAVCGYAWAGAAQEKKEVAATTQTTAAPAADPKDVKSLDAIVAAIYDVISGPPAARDWNRFNSLFTKDARLIAVRVPKEGGKPDLAVMTPAGYAARAGKYFL